VRASESEYEPEYPMSNRLELILAHNYKQSGRYDSRYTACLIFPIGGRSISYARSEFQAQILCTYTMHI